MADNPILLKNEIERATNSLKKAFKSGEDNTRLYNDVTRYLDNKQLGALYAKNAVAADLTDIFNGLEKEIRKTRSTYLPVELFLNAGGLFGEDISNTVAEKESYENTFMRMLGMPESELVEFAEALTIIKSTGSKETVPFETVLTDVLDQRQQSKNQRNVKIDGEIYNLYGEEVEEEEVEDLSLQESSPRLDSIGKDFHKFTYLLFPPVKDSRISKCINQPDKIVAPPFSNKRARTINSKKIRPTLLESVIRIRLDRLSGSESFSPDDDEESGESLISVRERKKVEAVPESYGTLEALFIVRIDSALRGLGIKMADDIDDIVDEFDKTGKRVAEPGGRSDGGLAPNEAAYRTDGLYPSGSKAEETNRKINIYRLENQKLIEDSLLTLLDDNSEVLDLQTQTQRNSSVRDSHLMSGLLGVMDVPRKKIEKELKEIERAKRRNTEEASDPHRAAINRSLGVSIGVGNIDILAFSLALFTMSEAGLLGLLSGEQLDRLKKEPGFEEITLASPKDILSSVNELTEFAYSAYERFRTAFSGKDLLSNNSDG